MRPICLSWNFRLKSMLLVWHTCRQETIKMLSGDEAGRHHLWTLHLPHFSSPVSPRKKSVLLSCNLTFMTDMQGTLLGHPDLMFRGTYAYIHTGLHIFALFQSCCLMELASRQLQSMCWLRSSSLGHWQDEQTLKYGEALKIKYITWTISKVWKTTKSLGRVEL